MVQDIKIIGNKNIGVKIQHINVIIKLINNVITNPNIKIFNSLNK